jgi:beta-phosphoglucomutase-like phosphatase (HAD superfamily)
VQLYLDCDGVLADFDRGATKLLDMPPRIYEKRHGIAAFWREIARHPDFYGTLPLMPDAKELFAAVRHLIPVILTGLPRGAWAAPQKIRWAARHFPARRF